MIQRNQGHVVEKEKTTIFAETSKRMQPIYLLADSQLLFWRENGQLWLQSLRERITSPSPKAAYLGASNGDEPQFYAIFEGAMNGVGISDCRQIGVQAHLAQGYLVLANDGQKRHTYIHASPQDFFLSKADQVFIQEADLILLAGGDVEKGWNVFTAVGLDALIRKRYHEGVILMGISAGAIQLGMLGWAEDGGVMRLFDTLQLVPFIIGAHEEEQDWTTLKEVLRHARETKRADACPWRAGLGIPMGGGAVYTPDQGVKAIRRPLVSFE